MERSPSKLARFMGLPPLERRLLLRAAYGLAVARIQLIATPFRRLCEQLAVRRNATPVDPDPALVGSVGSVVRAAANQVPWRSDCFPQAIAACRLLRAKGYATIIHIGVEKGEQGDLQGHAWLTCGDMVVTGGGDLERYTEMHRINA